MAVAGELFVDLLFADLDASPEPGSEVYARRFGIEPGGHGITAVTFARLGRPVTLGAVLGTDPLADAIMRRLDEEGVDTSCVARVEGGTPITAAITYRGDRSFVTHSGGAEASLYKVSASRALGTGARHLHLSAAHPFADHLLDIAASRAFSVSLSVGWQPALLGSPELRGRMAKATIVALNEREALAVSGKSDLGAAVEALSSLSPWLLVTLGAEGAVLANGPRRWRTPAAPAELVDATGAGDVFLATLIDGAMSGLGGEAALERAAYVAARAVEHLGGATGVPRHDADPFAAAHRPGQA